MKFFLSFIFIILFFYSNFVYAGGDYVNDYTLVDCLDGDDSKAVAFDSSRPYQTLKAGIEKTIEYINNNINIAGNEQTASGSVFTIKVNCVANDITNSNISLAFNGEKYNNDLIIEGLGTNGLIVKDFYFAVPRNSGHITFKNAQFLDNSRYGYYFNLDRNVVFRGYNYKLSEYNLFNYYGINIIDSYIKLKPGTYLASDYSYIIEYSICKSYCNHYLNRYSFFFNQIFIENSIIEIDIDSDYTYKNLFLTKNSKLNFINTQTGTYDITFINNSNDKSINNYGNSTFISNEIDFGGNNFRVDDKNKTNIAFINNKFSNFNNFDFSAKSMFFNNFIENDSSIDITNYKNLINNVFKSGFTSNYDKNNLRKNYSLDNAESKGIGWFFKIRSPLKKFNIDLSIFSLYKEVTGKDLPKNKNGTYVIYDKKSPGN